MNAHPPGPLVRSKNMRRSIAIATLLALALIGATPSTAASAQRVVFAGGCFWGMQLVFSSLKGVSAVAGYAGGNAATAHYEIVSAGETGHAESVEVTYDPSQISFKQLLDVYFLVAHDPTQLDRQGPDTGSQYRSEIFYTSDRQRDEAVSYIARLGSQHVYPSKIVTVVAPLRGFYPAEAYHQDFAVHNPQNPYIVYNDVPKMQKLRAEFPALVKSDAPFKE
jgi:peptide-methionine (S)-S-oxide reductase